MDRLCNIAKMSLDLLNSNNCQKSQCEVIEKHTDEFNYASGKFTLYRTFSENKLKITCIKDNKKGKIQINKFDDESINDAILNCIKLANSSEQDENFDIAPYIGQEKFNQGVLVPDLNKFFERSKEFTNDIVNKFPKIIIEEMVLFHERCNKLYMDSNKNKYYVEQGKYSLGLLFSAHDGEKSTSFNYSIADFKDLDTPFIELADVKKVLKDVENQLETTELKGKFIGTIITEPSCLCNFMYNIVTNFAGEDCIVNKSSIWLNKINKKVADERLTISFAPKDDRVINGDCYTEDGFIAEDFDFIKNGILKNFYIPLYVANKTKFKYAKNLSENLIVKNGETSLEDMIKNIDNGLLVGRFSGGMPSINGDFSGVAKNSFLIKNGKIVGALNEVMISGNFSEIINNINSISKEEVADGISVVPYISFNNVVISGK